jgi:DNA-binding NarL/FixJ family response regulator
MDILILSRSYSFERHVKTVLEDEHQIHVVHSRDDVISRTHDNNNHVLLAHISSCRESLINLLTEQKQTGLPLVTVGVAADTPNLREMLTLSQYGIRAYFNSYMADVHYGTMLRHFGEGQTWFAPDLLANALELARLNTNTEHKQNALNSLTKREKDVALAVGQGMSNRRIANDLGISERTVKTHLTRVFEKFHVKDRVALAIILTEMH